MFDMHDVVELTEGLDERLPMGTRGAIVMIYPSHPQEYEVEFVDAQGNTLDVRTVTASTLRIC